MKIDSTALTTFQMCPSKYQLRMEVGWKPRRISAALIFGKSIHAALATWYKTSDAQKSLLAIIESWDANAPVDDFRSREKCAKVFLEYIKEYPQENFFIVGAPDNPMIEVPFSLDTGMFCDCPHCGTVWNRIDGMCACGQLLEPIEYGGIYDGLIKFGPQVFVLEHKSTSMMGPGFFNQFKPNNQVSGYIWAGQQMSGLPVGGALINAIGVYAKGVTRFERSITTRTHDEVTEWLANVQTVCSEINRAKVTGKWEMRTPSCVLYGRCDYLDVHQLATIYERTKMLETSYIVDKWDYEAQDR